MGTDSIEGMDTMATKPAIRITAGDVPAPVVSDVDVVLFGGHMDGLKVSNVEVPGVWPVITTLEGFGALSSEGARAYLPRRYRICLCKGRVQLDRRRRVRYCLEG